MGSLSGDGRGGLYLSSNGCLRQWKVSWNALRISIDKISPKMVNRLKITNSSQLLLDATQACISLMKVWCWRCDPDDTLLTRHIRCHTNVLTCAPAFIEIVLFYITHQKQINRRLLRYFRLAAQKDHSSVRKMYVKAFAHSCKNKEK